MSIQRLKTICQVVAIVDYGNKDIRMWFCNVRTFLIVKELFPLSNFWLKGFEIEVP